MTDELYVADLNAPLKSHRLEVLQTLMALYHSGEIEKPLPTDYVNNHIHTTYSFSPYSPSLAAYTAWKEGLTTAGIMDHDSVGGAEEFIRAGEIIGIATTVGFECRCSMADTPFAGKRINNPDQDSVAYLAMHGIPHQELGAVEAFIAPYREKRNVRNREMTARLNKIIVPCGLHLDFDRDIAAISQCREGGSITERHILFALAGKMSTQIGKGAKLVRFLEEKFAIPVTGGIRDMLLDENNDMYDYYLLGLLKSHMVAKFYIEATDECPHVSEFVALANRVGAIAAYAYLGDVKGSVTGDKRDQTFEDGFLDELVAWLAEAGFHAITYMPTRNTEEQLNRVMALCDKYSLFQISGEDINSPFQSFQCEALQKPKFQHLVTATWALIGHEKSATRHPGTGMFAPGTVERLPELDKRIELFYQMGRSQLL